MTETGGPHASLGPNYRRLWSSSAVSNLADGIFLVALPLIAVRLTDSPMLVAGVSLAGRLPWLVFVLFAGALADRLDRRITMRNVQLMRVAVVGLMAVMAFTDTLSLPVLYVTAFVLGMGETLFDTAAQSIMPSIVSKDLLSRANSRLYAVELTMNAFIGPPLGGFLVAVSVPFALAGSVLGYGLAAVGLVLIVGTRSSPSGGPAQIDAARHPRGLRVPLGRPRAALDGRHGRHLQPHQHRVRLGVRALRGDAGTHGSRRGRLWPAHHGHGRGRPHGLGHRGACGGAGSGAGMCSWSRS